MTGIIAGVMGILIMGAFVAVHAIAGVAIAIGVAQLGTYWQRRRTAPTSERVAVRIGGTLLNDRAA